MKTTGEWPAFETPESSPFNFDGDWIASQHGKAVKVLDPHRPECRLPATGSYRIVWLDRDPKQQGKSQVKLLRTLMGIHVERKMWRAFAASCRADRPKALTVLLQLGPVLKLSFENILADPASAAALLSNHFGAGDPTKMITAVRLRPHRCLPDFAMEISLVLDETESAGG